MMSVCAPRAGPVPAIRQCAVQAPCGCSIEEEAVELLVARRLEALVAARPQPTVLGGRMHGAEHLGRAKMGAIAEAVAVRRMVEP